MKAKLTLSLHTYLLIVCAIILTCEKNREDLLNNPFQIIPAIAPESNDTTIKVNGLRQWYFHDSPVTHKYSSIKMHLEKVRISRDVDVWIDSTYLGRKNWCYDSIVTEIKPPINIASGAHWLILSETGKDTGFFASKFFMSQPYCVTVSNDWDNPSEGELFDSNLTMGYRLHQLHANLKMTHFVVPSAFTDSTIPNLRKKWLSDWLTTRRDNNQDEIGLHIHPECCFINLASIQCKTDSGYRSFTDPTGGKITLDRYTEEETFRMIKCADSVFLAWKLGTPVSFRAGAWTAVLHTLKALERAGFKIDASACNLTRGEEMLRYQLGNWLTKNWSTISDTSQPYHPSVTNINSAQKPSLQILEVPDNGILVDYIDSTEMIEVFQKNWPGGFLKYPRHFSIGYHPISFNRYFEELNSALNCIDKYLAENDSGPVFYVRMIDLLDIWK